MITYFMYREFLKSGEFDEEKNLYAGGEILLRVPILFILDIILIVRIINLFI